MTLGLMISLGRFTELSKVVIVIGLAKKFIWVFLYHLTENPELTSWPTQYDLL